MTHICTFAGGDEPFLLTFLSQGWRGLTDRRLRSLNGSEFARGFPKAHSDMSGSRDGRKTRRKQRMCRNRPKQPSPPEAPLPSTPAFLLDNALRSCSPWPPIHGGVFAGMSMSVRAVGNDLSILIGQYLRCKFLDFVRRNIQGSGNVASRSVQVQASQPP